MTKNELMETLDEFECLLAEGFEDALIGRTSGFNVVAVYDYELCVHILTEQDMTAEEAIEFMEFNVVGAYVGEKTPLFVNLSYAD